jgi:nitroreductase
MSDLLHPKIAHPDHDILEVIRLRWSPRAFDAARLVDRGTLHSLFEAARWAPSSRNEQPWRFIVADRSHSPDACARVLDALTPKNRAWAAAAPVLLVVALRATHEIDGAANAHAWYDAGQAVAFLVLQATASGLSTRQMQGFDADRVRQACAVPPPFDPAIVVAVGYAGDPDSLAVESHRAAESQQRVRRAVAEFVFENTWGHPLEPA